jgi:hypothetical protein
MMHSIVESMSAVPLDLDGGDTKSDREIAERADRYRELAAYINAEPDEIGTPLLLYFSLSSLYSHCYSLFLYQLGLED